MSGNDWVITIRIIKHKLNQRNKSRLNDNAMSSITGTNYKCLKSTYKFASNTLQTSKNRDFSSSKIKQNYRSLIQEAN